MCIVCLLVDLFVIFFQTNENNCHEEIDNVVVDNDLDIAPDSPTLPTYFSPPPSPQPFTEEVPVSPEDFDNHLYNEDELEALERYSILQVK
jgi:hypothetical protein